MFHEKTLFFFFFFLLLSLCILSFNAEALNTNEFTSGNGTVASVGAVVTKDQRKPLIVTEYGEISVIDIEDETRGPYHIQFFTLEPNSLFLPVLLHADMVLYVHTGSGALSWMEEEDDDLETVNLKRGDIFRLKAGSVFYLQSTLEPQREKLRINAIFVNSDEDDSPLESSTGAYSSISDLVRGFDKKTLQAAFNVPEEVIEVVTNTTESLVIVHAVPTKEENSWQFEAARLLKAFVGGTEENKKKKKKSTKAYNLLNAKPDFQNCNGWSLTVTNSHLLKRINIGIFMVNLTKGAMMGPHWNPKATEISVVLHGSGMIRVVCPSIGKNDNTNCKNTRFRVQEGDVFSVTRYHPMAQISFNNDSFVFMGFSTTTGKNHPQFLAGKKSVLKTLDRDILAVSFNVTKPTIDKILAPQVESIILDCTSCAEEEERLMVEEIEKEKEEEAAKRREEEEKSREEEEARKREEEEKRKREEEERKREEEEARKREEEEKRKREEEERKREEEEARKREEEEKRKREEEERKREEEEARKREEEEEKRKREEEREREQAGGGEDEEAEWEQEEAKRQEEERRRRRREEEEGGGGGGPEKLDAEARSEKQEKEGVKEYLKLWRG